MFELINQTPYVAALVPGLDLDGRDFVTVSVKAAFELPSPAREGAGLEVADEQVPLVMGDEHFGEPAASSLKYESEVGPPKNGTDVVLVGHAYAPGGSAEVVEAGLQAGPVSKTVYVYGDRRWQRLLGTARPSSPEPFDKMPLVYERAFGGADLSHSDPSRHSCEERNPVGRGYSARGGAARGGAARGGGDSDEALLLPNIEDPANLISRVDDRPAPAGFGFIARHWEPRKSLAGTYDDEWKNNRNPLLPVDFDERYYRSAHPELCVAGYLKGGEQVRLKNVSAEGEESFALPGVSFELKAYLQGEEAFLEALMDTVLIEPDLRRVSVIWKATLKCPGRLKSLDFVRIRELERYA